MTEIHEALKPLAVSIDSLNPDPSNARKHDKRNIEAIKASLARFGQTKPIVLHENGTTIIAGNGTWHAAKELGWTEIAAAKTNLDAAEAVAYGIADNKTAELAEWEDDTLRDLMDALPDDLKLATGFEGDEIADMLRLPTDQVDEDEVPPAPDQPVTQPGDLWLLGGHRLICGSSADHTTLTRLFDGRKADMLLTDPPYGVSYVGKTKDALTIENDELDEEQLAELMKSVFDLCDEFTREGAYWYATVPAGPLFLVFAEDWKRRGILRQMLVWAKDTMVMGRSEYHYKHEPILFGWKEGQRHKNNDRTRTSVWEVDRPKVNREHPTMKPVELWSKAIKDGSRSGEIIFDPFLGSGTTIIAADQMGCLGYGCELDPKYCDVIVQRWETLTGETAERVALEDLDASTVGS